MKEKEYALCDVDGKVLKYFDAYIKQTLKYTKIDYMKCQFNDAEHSYFLKDNKDNLTENSCCDKYICGKVQVDEYLIEFESETLFKQVMVLTKKQREVLLKNVVLGIPMSEIAKQMGICENNVYKHKRKALAILIGRIKKDEV